MGEVLGADEAELDLGGTDDQGQKILRREGGSSVDRKAEVRTVFTRDREFSFAVKDHAAVGHRVRTDGR